MAGHRPNTTHSYSPTCHLCQTSQPSSGVKLTKPLSTSLWFALAFLGMLSRLLSASTIAGTTTGREGEGEGEGGGGIQRGKGSACLTTTAMTMNTTTKTKQQCGGWEGVAWGSGQWGESNYDGCNVVRRPSVGGMGQRSLIVGPHTAAAIFYDDDCRRSGGMLCPPPLVHPVLPDAHH
jgi:hypothetical protein